MLINHLFTSEYMHFMSNNRYCSSY